MKFSPVRMYRAVKRFCREAHYTLMGHRDREIRQDIEQLRASVVAIKLDTFIDIRADRESRPDIAVVTCLPPDETGIARFSEIMLLGLDCAVDIHTEFPDYSKLVHVTRKLAERKAESNIYPVDRIVLNQLQKKYRTVVFVIGNSNHNVPLLRAMRDFINAFGAENVWCYLHDPTCFNVVRRVLNLTERQFAEHLVRLHGKSLSEVVSDQRYIFDQLIDSGLYGARALTHDIGARKFIVNSHAARDILIDNCGDKIEHIEVLYHPVFDLDPGFTAPAPSAAALTIGTYGCPSHMKHTDMVLKACDLLVKDGLDLRLIVSGYEAEVFADRYFHGRIPTWIDVSHAETEAEFQTEMAKCDIALQLRKRNTGESSGVIPTLLRMGKTVITSDIGAFGDYGDAVLYFSGAAKDLAALLRSRPVVAADTIAAFVAQHDSAAFSRNFARILGLPQSLPAARQKIPTDSTRITKIS